MAKKRQSPRAGSRTPSRSASTTAARSRRAATGDDTGSASATAPRNAATATATATVARFVARPPSAELLESAEQRLSTAAEREAALLAARGEESAVRARTGSLVTLSALAEAASANLPRDRVVDSLDLEDLGLRLQVGKDDLADLLGRRLDAVTRVYGTLEFLGKDLSDLLPKLPPRFPSALAGRLVNPDGSDAADVSVVALQPEAAAGTAARPAWPKPETRTDAHGNFRLALPRLPVPDSGLTLRVRGGNRSVDEVLPRTLLVGGLGDVGIVALDQHVTPLPRSVIAQLGDVLLPTTEDAPLENPEEFAEPAHAVTLGEGDCARSFRSNTGVIDRFSYSVLVRLVAPSLSAPRASLRFPVADGRRYQRLSASSATLAAYVDAGQLIESLSGFGQWRLTEREPIEAPIDVSRFLHAVETNPRAVPKASTLALGYTVHMRQVWLPTGMSLGDLVYSLPLAPGEQQRIAVSEERETLTVREMETLSADEQQRYNEQADTSAAAVFSSAFDESASGGSRMKTSTESGSFGGGLAAGGLFGPVIAGLGIGGGYSDSTTTGSASSWQTASRDYLTSSTQAFHSNLSRQASARRNASRSSVRLASSSERREVVTKVITNHNHNHALTMQYWQVLRHFNVSSTVDDVQLVCFVPLELVQFLPPYMPRRLPSGQYARDTLLMRYDMLLRHHDVIAPRVARDAELRHGLRLLRELAGNPTMTVEGSAGPAQDILNLSFVGTFLPFEDVYATAYSETGARIGPVRLEGASADVPAGLESKAALIEALRKRRGESFETRTAALALPEHIARSSLARVEFTRVFRTFSYRLGVPDALELGSFTAWLGALAHLDVQLSPAELERELAGPLVRDPSARINGSTEALEAYNGAGGSERMPATMPVAARRLPPVMAYADLLRIEALLQHVVENTVPFSKAVWQSLTPEERAILLERYTIGVPDGGIADASDEVPLLNCVANQVLGYFGNAAIMPFFIPEPLSRAVGFTSRQIQDALLAFHRQAFQPARTALTLPARGVLGEAVLGSCNSSEKIDLTRFWNWQDSPAPQADDLAGIVAALGGGNQLVGPAGANAPATLQSSPMVTINQGPAAFTPPDLAAKLIASLPASNLPTDLTGMAQLGAQMKVQTETTAETLNKTISEASGLAKAAMTALPEAMKAKAGVDEAEKKKKEEEEKKKKEQEQKDGGGATDGATDGGAAPTA